MINSIKTRNNSNSIVHTYRASEHKISIDKSSNLTKNNTHNAKEATRVEWNRSNNNNNDSDNFSVKVETHLQQLN
jgi:hypothetical protein